MPTPTPLKLQEHAFFIRLPYVNLVRVSKVKSTRVVIEPWTKVILLYSLVVTIVKILQ